MLKNIKLHLENDEEKQQELEKTLAEYVINAQRENINAFQRNIPSVVPLIQSNTSDNISIFCNKHEQINIVDFGMGRVFYGFNPDEEIARDVEGFFAYPLSVSLDESEKPEVSADFAQRLVRFQSREPVGDSIELLVVLGLGLGKHLMHILERKNVKHLIVYEPEQQYFGASISGVNWKHILDVAKTKGTAIYLQIGKDARDLIEDIKEFRAHFAVDQMYVYQHYHHVVFNAIVEQLSNTPWPVLQKRGLNLTLSQSSSDYRPLWTPAVSLAGVRPLSNEDATFQANIETFRKYFPAVAKEFVDYQPQVWFPIRNHCGRVNIVHGQDFSTWYDEDPLAQCETDFAEFAKSPHIDGLMLGYTGEKLKHYTHYKFVNASDEILAELDDKESTLPDVIKSIIMFGVGVGYQVEMLCENHDVEKLFICEPNRDFFYASLFAVNWEKILSDIDKRRGRVYINIGDDGSNLFKDLINQFYSIGPYILNNTYFYQAYYNEALNSAIAQLREQLRVVISMGEYYDHARFGINQTKEGLQQGLPHLTKNAADALSAQDREIPVVLVGNGPSLDTILPELAGIRDRVILVSCGTALQTLHRNGIKPDFHAEIEQNRSTFDWAARVGDFDYLKSVSLISCNGVHPDTCELYKDVFISFKAGESSTVSAFEIVSEDDFEVLRFSFPTVTNFALNLFIKLGFQQIYFAGVDLGFKNNKQHHSKQSGYYDESGKQKYDYAADLNTSLVVPGNFSKRVFTKHEFKVAKIIMEQSIATTSADCYNLSDGAKINGASPLKIEQLLIVSDAQQKTHAVSAVKERCFRAVQVETFKEQFEARFQASVLSQELEEFQALLEQNVDSVEQAEKLVEDQKRLLFTSYQNSTSLLFYLLYGTVNYSNVIFSKVAYADDEANFDSALFAKAMEKWKKCLAEVVEQSRYYPDAFDVSNSFGTDRTFSFLRALLGDKRILVLSQPDDFYRSAAYFKQAYPEDIGFDLMDIPSLQRGATHIQNEYDFVILRCDDHVSADVENTLQCAKEHGARVLVVTSEQHRTASKTMQMADTALFVEGHFEEFAHPHQYNEYSRFILCLYYLADVFEFDSICQKVTVSENTNLADIVSLEKYKGLHIYDLGKVLAFSKNKTFATDVAMKNGSHIRYLGKELALDMLVINRISQASMDSQKTKVKNDYPFLLEENVHV